MTAPAHYYEYYKSGEGDSTGLSGLDASRTFIVHVDAVGDDPITIIQSGFGTQNGIPIGSPHPNSNRFPYAIAFDYIKEEQLAPTIWRMRIPYRLPSAATPSQDEWLLRWSVATETELMKTDLTGKPTGAHAYEIVPAAAVVPPEPDPGRKGTPGDDVIYWAFDKTKLRRIGGRRNVGISRTRPVHAFSLSRTLTQVTAMQLALVATYDNKINSQKMWRFPNHSNYYMFDKRLVKFVGMDFREEVSVVEGQTQSGLVYPTELNYLVNFDGWSPVKKFDVWPDGHGNESLIYATDGLLDPVSDDFVLYEEANLHNIIFALGGGTIRLFGART